MAGVESWTIAEFKRAKTKVKVRSSVLGKDVWLVSDDEIKDSLVNKGIDPGLIYLADELLLIVRDRYSPCDLRDMHTAKEIFGGIIVSQEDVFQDAEDVSQDAEDVSRDAENVSRNKDTLGKRILFTPEEIVNRRIFLGRLASRVASCRRCGLSSGRNRVVVGEGYPGGLMIIGEAPGRQEDATGRPFVGRAGKVLEEMLALVGLKRKDVYITNVVKCRPVGGDGKDRPPSEEEVAACSFHLKQQILLLKPELIVTLGATALKYFYPGAYVSELHGRFLEYDGAMIFPTYHPAAIFRKPELREVMRQDFLYLSGHIGGRRT